MKKNGHKRNYAAEIAFDQKARTIPPTARRGLLDWLRRAHVDPERSGGGHRPPRTFWLLDPATGKWHLL